MAMTMSEGGKKRKGLVNRREKEIEMWEGEGVSSIGCVRNQLF